VTTPTTAENTWSGLINRQKRIPPIIREHGKLILDKGHFKAK
jgi:hypothetical protein